MDRNFETSSKGSILTDVQINEHRIITGKLALNIFKFLSSAIILLSTDVKYDFYVNICLT